MHNFLSSFENIFWDVDYSSLDKEKNKSFIIERVLEYGDLPDFKRLRSVYSIEEIREVLKKAKSISFKSANFYALILGVPRKEVLCLRKPLMQKQDRF